MNEHLIRALRGRAAADAQRFREQYPDELPTERWLDNSFTAALALAEADAGMHPPAADVPPLFEVYAEEVARVVGCIREDMRQDGEVPQLPTPGEH